MQFFLWCPDYSGPQHCYLNPATHIREAGFPTEAQLTVMAGIRLALPYPTGCHFDFDMALLPDDLDPHIRTRVAHALPGHYHEPIRTYQLDTEHARQYIPMIAKCSLHGTRPQIFFRRSAYNRRHEVIHNRFWTYKQITPDALQPWRTWNIWINAREPARTLTSVW